jgi:heavy metal sensor kinase
MAVLMIFGGIVYELHWRTRLQQIDAELDRTVDVVVSQLRRLLPWPSMFPQPGRWPAYVPQQDQVVRTRPTDVNRNDSKEKEEGKPEEAASADQAKPDRESELRAVAGRGDPEGEPNRNRDRDQRDPRDRGRGGPNRGRDGRPPGSGFPQFGIPGLGMQSGFGASPGFGFPPGPGNNQPFKLPEEFLQLFQGEEESRPYFVIWDRAGKQLQKSETAPTIEYPNIHIGRDDIPVREVRLRDGYREVIHAIRFDICVLVGRSIQPDVAEHHRSGALLALAGLGVLAAGLVGGWWLSSRAIRPIAVMTATADAISIRNLSERIDVRETDTELGELATVLNRTFDRLQAAFEQQSRFTADASHELRTPLSAILMNTELALSRQRSPEEYRTALETCRRASQRMKSLIECLLALARFDSGNSALDPRELDLEPVVQDCVDLMRPLADERHISINRMTVPTTVRGDHDRIAQVLTNLLSNAIRYNRDGGEVKLGVGAENGHAVITVSDTGIGIAPDELPHIFDRFYRADKSRSRADGGSGLGLAICKTIVDAHGGTITARSEPERGTTIEVRLPRSE